MGERLLCKQEVIGSIPFTSTILLRAARFAGLPSEALAKAGCLRRVGSGGSARAQYLGAGVWSGFYVLRSCSLTV